MGINVGLHGKNTQWEKILFFFFFNAYTFWATWKTFFFFFVIMQCPTFVIVYTYIVDSFL